jgi:hypothetical protein
MLLQKRPSFNISPRLDREALFDISSPVLNIIMRTKDQIYG